MATTSKKPQDSRNDFLVYEVGYLLLPTLNDEKVAAAAGDFKSAVSEAGGSFIGEEYPKVRRLSYPVSKSIGGKKTPFESAYFGWIKFESAAAGAQKLKNFFGGDDRVLRFLLNKTVKDSVLARPKLVRPARPAEGGKAPVFKPSLEKEPAKPISDEELDTAIEKLVVK